MVVIHHLLTGMILQVHRGESRWRNSNGFPGQWYFDGMFLPIFHFEPGTTSRIWGSLDVLGAEYL